MSYYYLLFTLILHSINPKNSGNFPKYMCVYVYVCAQAIADWRILPFACEGMPNERSVLLYDVHCSGRLVNPCYRETIIILLVLVNTP